MPFGYVGAAVSTATGIAGAVNAGDASSSAAQTQANSADAATALQRDIFNTTTKNFAPFLNAGTNALPALTNYIGLNPDGTFNPNAPGVSQFGPPPTFDPSKISQDPAYQFQLGQGTEAIRNNSARSGGVNSGNTLKALMGYGQGLAAQNYQQDFNLQRQDYWNQYNAYTQNQGNIFNRLNSVVGSGQNAAGSLGAFGNSFGQQAGSNLIGAGNALAAGQVGQANAFGSALGGGSNALVQLLNRFGGAGGGGGNGSFFGGGGGGGGMDFGSTLPLSFEGSTVPSFP